MAQASPQLQPVMSLQTSAPQIHHNLQNQASKLLRAMASPIRIQVLVALGSSEKNVSTLLEEIKCTQPNLSQHLSGMHRAGLLAKRRDGVNIYYRIADSQVGAMCRSVCAQMLEARN